MSDKAKLIQLIHIGKQQLNMDDFSYREMVKRLTNKTTSTKCTVVELHKILHELQQKGAKVKWFAKRSTKSTAYSPATGEIKVKSEIAHKIRAVWSQMSKQGMLRDGSEAALNKWVRNVVNPIYQKRGQNLQILNVGALDNQMATLVLEMLKRWQARSQKQN